MLHEAIDATNTSSEGTLDSRTRQHAHNLLRRVTDFWKKATEKGGLQKEEYETIAAAKVLGKVEGKSFMVTLNSFMSGKSMPTVHKIIESRVNALENAVKELQKKVQEHDDRLDKLEATVEVLKSCKAPAAPTRGFAQGHHEAGQEEGRIRIKEQPLLLKFMSGKTVCLMVRFLEWNMSQLMEEACKHCEEDVRLVFAGVIISDKKYFDVKLADMKLQKESMVHVLSAKKTDFNAECEATFEEATEEAEEQEAEDVEEAEAEAEAEKEVTQTEVGASSSSCMWWTCKVCTFAENSDVAPVCQMCESAKGVENAPGEDACGEQHTSIAEEEAAFFKRKHEEMLLNDEKAAKKLSEELASERAPRKSMRCKKA